MSSVWVNGGNVIQRVVGRYCLSVVIIYFVFEILCIVSYVYVGHLSPESQLYTIIYIWKPDDIDFFYMNYVCICFFIIPIIQEIYKIPCIDITLFSVVAYKWKRGVREYISLNLFFFFLIISYRENTIQLVLYIIFTLSLYPLSWWELWQWRHWY